MDWDDLRYFTKVAETGSLLAAARFLRVNVATVSRHVERLEAELGRRLFVRSAQGYRLSPDGARLADWAQRMQREFAGLPELFGEDAAAPEGPVSLATTEPLANHFIAPLLPELLARHPGISLEISGEIRHVNLSRRESDIALRLGSLPSGNLRARRIGEIGYAFYASPAYLKTNGTPRRDGGLSHHALIAWPATDARNAYGDWLREVAPDARPVLQSSNGDTRLQAARAGLGIALLPCFMVGAKAGLKRLDLGLQPPRVDLSLVTHAELSARPAIRAVLDFIAESAKTQRARLRGD